MTVEPATVEPAFRTELVLPVSFQWQQEHSPPVTFSFDYDLDPDRIKMNHRAKYLCGQRSFCSKVITWIHRQTHTRVIDCSTRLQSWLVAKISDIHSWGNILFSSTWHSVDVEWYSKVRFGRIRSCRWWWFHSGGTTPQSVRTHCKVSASWKSNIHIQLLILASVSTTHINMYVLYIEELLCCRKMNHKQQGL